MSKVITRFPPSPTGKFHIGSARTALFNYLFAKHQNGDFILRFEDTDKDRSTLESEEDIKKGMEWLGLKWDGPISHQLNNIEKHVSLAQKLITEEKAYEKDGAIWFRVIKDKEILVKDLIRGDVRFNTKEFEDFVIIRSSGIPIYYFSNAIDDAEDGITHVLRGEEHLTNTPKQILILEALGFKTPGYGHMPLILNEDRTKLSKRSGSTSLTDYMEEGYLPESIINFLAFLGWNPGDEREYFTLEELIKEFSLERVQKSPAVFNIEKLNSINKHYLDKLSDDDYEKISGLNYKLVKVVRDRAKTIKEARDQADETNIFNDKYKPEILIFKKSNKEKTLMGLNSFLEKIKENEDWNNLDHLNDLLTETVEENKLDNGSVFWPVRVALSGKEKSMSPAELLWFCEKDTSLKRINLALKKLN